MKRRTAREGFKSMKDLELLNHAGTTLAAMRDNGSFPNPVPPLDEVQAAYDDYRTKLEIASMEGSPYDKSLKRDSKAVLAGLMKQLAFHVNTVADGDLSTILSSGIPPTRMPEKLLPPDTPTGPRLVDYLLEGEFDLVFDSVPEAVLYEYCLSTEKDVEGNIIWGDPITLRRSRNNILTGLELEKRHYVRVRARNAAGISKWSHTVSRIAQ